MGTIEINRDKVSFILMLGVILADILYILIYSMSIILNIVIILWILVMAPNILVYMRGNGKWKNSQNGVKVIR